MAELDCLTVSMRTRNEATYVVEMQIALILSEIGNASADGRNFLEEAAAIYARLEDRWPNRLVILYRHAKVLDALGHADIAIDKLRSVTARLSLPKEVTPARHWIRSAAPRVLGVILWEEAIRVGELGGAADSTARERKVELLREAYDVTKEAYGLRVKDDPFEAPHQPSERAKAANNLLYYALELAATTGLPNGADGPLKQDIEQYLADMDAEDPAKLTDPRFLNTAARAYEYLGQRDLARSAAQRFLDIITPLSSAEWQRTPLNEMMEKDAHRLAANV